MNVLFLSIEDFLTPKMLKYAILPFLATLLAMYVLFFIVAGIGIDSMHASFDVHSATTTIQNGIPHTDTFSAHIQNSSIVQFLMKYALTSWLASFLVYAVGGFFVLYASVFIAVIVLGFMTPVILKELQRRHYKDVQIVGYSNPLESIWLIFKWIVVMILLFILLIPFYFIPLLNIIAFNLPLYYFFHNMLLYDISSNLTTREENDKIRYFNKNSLRLKTLFLYIISLVPFVIFFVAVFYVVYIGNTYFIEVRKLRGEKI